MPNHRHLAPRFPANPEDCYHPHQFQGSFGECSVCPKNDAWKPRKLFCGSEGHPLDGATAVGIFNNSWQFARAHAVLIVSGVLAARRDKLHPNALRRRLRGSRTQLRIDRILGTISRWWVSVSSTVV